MKLPASKDFSEELQTIIGQIELLANSLQTKDVFLKAWPRDLFGAGAILHGVARDLWAIRCSLYGISEADLEGPGNEGEEGD